MGTSRKKRSVTPNFFWLYILRLYLCLTLHGLQVEIVALSIVYGKFHYKSAINSIGTVTCVNSNRFGSNKVYNIELLILHQLHMITCPSRSLVTRYGRKSVEVRKKK